jgi:alpha-glucosidase (family GH31 glycosyl hydrolase)
MVKHTAQLLQIYRLLNSDKTDAARTKLAEFEYEHGLDSTPPILSAEPIPGLAWRSFYLWLYLLLHSRLPAQRDQTILQVERFWQAESSNIFDGSPDVYTSNLALFYVTLQTVKNRLKIFSVQKTMTEIRDYVFENLIKDGALVRSLNDKRPNAEVFLSVALFHLFDPEELIVVAAKDQLMGQANFATDGSIAAHSAFRHTQEMEQVPAGARDSGCPSLRAPAGTCSQVLLGLYFYEKSEIGRADFYLREVLGAFEPDSSSIAGQLAKLLEYNLAVWAGHSSIRILHKPLGNGNVYEPLPYERAPHYPKVGEACSYFVQVFSVDAKVTLGIELQDGTIIEYDHMNCDVRQLIYEFKVLTEPGFVGAKYFFKMANSTGVYQTAYYDLKLSEVASCESDFPATATRLIGGGIISIRLSIPIPPHSSIYGLGERFNALNQSGHKLQNFVYNQYHNQNDRTYIPVPFFMTDQNFGIWVETDCNVRFDFSSPGVAIIDIEQNPERPDFQVHRFEGNLKEQLSQFNKETLIKDRRQIGGEYARHRFNQRFLQATGDAEMVPVWALGLWMSSHNWDRDSIVRRQVEIAQTLDIPATVIVFEQWSDEQTFYMWNDSRLLKSDTTGELEYQDFEFPEWSRWPDPAGLIEHLNQQGLKTLLWQIPILRSADGLISGGETVAADEKTAIESGYLVKNADGSPYRIPEGWFTDCYLCDFTNQEACDWWFERRRHLLETGVAGFKTDGGEMVFGKDLQFAGGLTGHEMRNLYPNRYVGAYYDFVRENQGITFSRAGYTGLAKFPAHWAGDENSTWEAYRNSLVAGLNAGLSGMVFWGWDLAGFSGDIPTAELFIRATQMAAFCPIMQYHAESKGEFNQDRTPWNIAERTGHPEVIEHFRFYANLRMNLLPYIYDQSLKAIEQHGPLMKAMILEYPDEPEFADVSDQYLFGEALLVAPVLEAAAGERTVLLPPGKWLDFWTHHVYPCAELSTVTATAALNRIPVFIKANSALLLNVGETDALGESIGNDVTRYTKARLLVVAESEFSTTIKDYLGNRISVTCTADGAMKYKVQVSGLPEPYEVEVIEV